MKKRASQDITIPENDFLVRARFSGASQLSRAERTDEHEGWLSRAGAAHTTEKKKKSATGG